MKTKSLIILTALCVGLIGTTILQGCKTATVITTNPDGTTVTNTTQTIDTARIASVANQAANVGTTEVLTAHPEWRAQFQLAADDLNQLAVSPSIGVQDILNIVQRLPVKELKSSTARIAFEGATILISAIDVPELPADRLAQLQPIAKAIADGITTGMANVPVALPESARMVTPASPSPVPAVLIQDQSEGITFYNGDDHHYD